MVGAGVLILALVIVGPMVLDGGSGGDVVDDAVPGQRSEELGTHTFRLNQAFPAGQTAGDSGSMAAPAAPRADLPPQAGMVQQQTALPPAAVTATAQPEPRPAGASVAAAPPRPAATSGGGWLVQVGTFGQKDNAERLAASLKQRGFAAFVSPTARDGKTMFRVRVGPSGSRDGAAGVAGKLAAAGQSGQIVVQ